MSDAYASTKKINRLNPQRDRLRFMPGMASLSHMGVNLSFRF